MRRFPPRTGLLARLWHWLWRLLAWLLLTLVLDIAWWFLGTPLGLPILVVFLIPAGGNFALAWALGLVGWRSAAAIAASLVLLLLSFAQLYVSLVLMFPLDHMVNGPH